MRFFNRHFLILLLSLFFWQQSATAEGLDDQVFFTIDETSCLSPGETRRLAGDFNLDEFPPAEPNECEAPYWTLLSSLSALTRLATGDVKAPSQWLAKLPSHVAQTIASITTHETPELSPAEFDFEKNELKLNPSFFRLGPVARLAFLIHASRHFEDGHYLHVICPRGPIKGIRACDERYSQTGGGANAATVYGLSGIYLDANTERVNPVTQAYARHLANAILTLGFSAQPDELLR